MDPSADQDLKTKLSGRFAQLPKVVQDAILSADIETHMRTLAAEHQLHFDQWTTLENEVMFALLGLQPIEKLADNIAKEVGVPHVVAVALADDVSRIVFQPIREVMERELAAQPSREGSGSRDQVPGNAQASVAPGTPPPAPPESKAVRAPVSENYVPTQTSTARKTVHDDPYRESPI